MLTNHPNQEAIWTAMAHTLLRPVRPPAAKAGPIIDVEASEAGEHLRPHPLGVRPEGNAFTDRPAARPPRECAGRFRALPDELLARTCSSTSTRRALCALGGTCKLLYAFTRVDDLWRTLFVARQALHSHRPYASKSDETEPAPSSSRSAGAAPGAPPTCASRSTARRTSRARGCTRTGCTGPSSARTHLCRATPAGSRARTASPASPT